MSQVDLKNATVVHDVDHFLSIIFRGGGLHERDSAGKGKNPSTFKSLPALNFYFVSVI